MKKKILSLALISLFLISTVSSCTQGKKRTDLNLEKNETNMKNDGTLYIYYQSKVIDSIPHKDAFIKRYEWLSYTNYGSNIEENEIGKEPYHLEQADLDLGIKVIKKALTIKGLKDVGENQFYKQVYKYFNLTEDEIKSEKKTIFTKDCFVIVEYPIDAGNKDLFLSPEMKYTYFYPNMSIIAFFPEITNITTLRDDKNLELDNKSVDFLYHYNNYLLYDSQSSLTWLSINTSWSLLELFEKYKYNKEPKINKIGLDFAYKKYRPSETEYNETNAKVLFDLFYQKIDQNLYIYEDLLDYISKGEQNKTDFQAVDMMYSCASLMVSETDNVPNLTKEERFKIATYLGYYIQQYYNSYVKSPVDRLDIEGAPAGSFYRNAFVRTPSLVKHIRENNYYRLEDLEIMTNTILEQINIQSDAYNARMFREPSSDK